MFVKFKNHQIRKIQVVYSISTYSNSLLYNETCDVRTLHYATTLQYVDFGYFPLSIFSILPTLQYEDTIYYRTHSLVSMGVLTLQVSLYKNIIWCWSPSVDIYFDILHAFCIASNLVLGVSFA